MWREGWVKKGEGREGKERKSEERNRRGLSYSVQKVLDARKGGVKADRPTREKGRGLVGGSWCVCVWGCPGLPPLCVVSQVGMLFAVAKGGEHRQKNKMPRHMDT